MEILELSQWVYFSSTVASFLMLWFHQSITRALLVVGYTIFSLLYIFDIEYTTEVGYFAWSAINFLFFYEIIVADKLRCRNKRKKKCRC